MISEWEALGTRQRLQGNDVFVIDAASDAEAGKPPLLVLHGFPTSSIDFAMALPALRAERRVVLVDLLGFGCSDKPDQAYSLFAQADLVEAVVGGLGIGSADLLTHDMGDSVGGELLARSIDGTLGFDIERRVVTNGSIYLEMAQLTDGQKLLASLPDERAELPMGPAEIDQALRQLLGSEADVDEVHLRSASELVCRDAGVSIMPRLIRYLEERRRHEGRWTGAIESHPAPLTIVWGDQDPIAVYGMAERLRAARPDAGFVRLEGMGHFPMIEAPNAFAAAVLSGLS